MVIDRRDNRSAGRIDVVVGELHGIECAEHHDHGTVSLCGERNGDRLGHAVDREVTIGIDGHRFAVVRHGTEFDGRTEHEARFGEPIGFDRLASELAVAAAAVGAALAEKDKGAISCIFMGDGTMGEGSVYEALDRKSVV